MTLEKLIEMFDGQPSDKHTLEVGLDDIRTWHAEIARLRGKLRYIAAQAKAGHPGALAVIAANADDGLSDRPTLADRAYQQCPQEQK